MNRKTLRTVPVLLVLVLVVTSATVAAVTVVNFEGFEDGSADGWVPTGGSAIGTNGSVSINGSFSGEITATDDDELVYWEDGGIVGDTWVLEGYFHFSNDDRVGVAWINETGHGGDTYIEFDNDGANTNENVQYRTRQPGGNTTILSDNSDILNGGWVYLRIEHAPNASMVITWETPSGGNTRTLSPIAPAAGEGTGPWNLSVFRTAYQSNGTTTNQFDSLSLTVYAEPPVINESSATPTGNVSGTETFTIDVSDADFPLGDRVNMSLYLGGVYKGSANVTANGTATVAGVDVGGGGTKTVRWEATDWSGATDSYEYEILVPASLNVYNESAPDQLINDRTVTGVFYIEDANGTVITRETNSGAFPLSIADTDQRVTVQLEAPGYVTRTFHLGTLTDNSSAFLLPVNESQATVRFILDDNSGDFSPSGDVILYVERGLNQSGVAQYRVVSSDRFDATDSIVVTLRDETRHRLRVVNDRTGDTRVPGAYTTRGDAVETIQIGQLTIVIPNQTSSAFDAILEDPHGTPLIRTAYRDTDDLSHTLDVSIYELGNVSNSITVNDTTTASGAIISTYPVPPGNEPSTTWVVEWKVTEPGGENESGRKLIGGAADLGGRFNFDPDVQAMIGYVILVALVGLAVIIDARRLAPVVATVVATGLTAFNILAFPAPVLGFAGVATVFLVMTGGE